jgi:hypothetical protein
MHEHKPVLGRYNNVECKVCGKIFARNIIVQPDYVQHRTDSDRDI